MPLLIPPSPQKSLSYHRKSTESFSSDIERSLTVHKDEEESFLCHQNSRQRKIRFSQILAYFLTATLFFILGSLSSQLLRFGFSIDNYPRPYGHSSHTKTIIWNANPLFADEPSEATDAAWGSLIPKGRGFVVHPKLAPADGREKQGKSVSVFHQLHCLQAIRTASSTTAYLLRKERDSATNSNTLFPHDDLGIETSRFTVNPYIEAQLQRGGAHHLEPDHLAHCFDYIRQALMCAADSNLEDVATMDDENGEPLTGAEGWGSKRVCRDFWGLYDWSEKWRGAEGGGIS